MNIYELLKAVCEVEDRDDGGFLLHFNNGTKVRVKNTAEAREAAIGYMQRIIQRRLNDKNIDWDNDEKIGLCIPDYNSLILMIRMEVLDPDGQVPYEPDYGDPIDEEDFPTEGHA